MESGELFHKAHSGKIGEYFSLRPTLGGKLVLVVTRPRRSLPPKRSQLSKAILSKRSSGRFRYGCCRAFLSSGLHSQSGYDPHRQLAGRCCLTAKKNFLERRGVSWVPHRHPRNPGAGSESLLGPKIRHRLSGGRSKLMRSHITPKWASSLMENHFPAQRGNIFHCRCVEPFSWG